MHGQQDSDRPNRSGLSRRSFITRTSLAAGGAAGAGWLAGCTDSNARTNSQPTGLQANAAAQGNRLVLLGTAGGPVWWPRTQRRGISSALVVNGQVYLVDCGEGTGERLKEAALVPESMRTPGGLWGMENLRAVFLTHLHSDHIIDYPNLLLYGWYSGLIRAKKPVEVHGPGPRGANVPLFRPPGKQAPEPPVINPNNSTPGTVDTTNSLHETFALDENDRMRDQGKPDLRSLVHAHDIPLPANTGYHPDSNPSPPIEPFHVYEDDNVRVTATLVNHYPVAPAFAFRFDTSDGSVVFSGDTNRNDNLIRLAQNADVLVHEVIDPAWIDSMYTPPLSAADEALKNHLLISHTPISEVGAIAAAANAKSLVLSHIVPGNAPDAHLQRAQHGYDGKLIIGQDLMQLPIRTT